MADIHLLPKELMSMIFGHCTHESLLAAHRVSRAWAESAKPWLFQSVLLTLSPESCTRFYFIASNRTLRDCVKEILVKPQLLPTFPSSDAWLACVDVRPFLDHFCKHGDSSLESVYHTRDLPDVKTLALNTSTELFPPPIPEPHEVRWKRLPSEPGQHHPSYNDYTKLLRWQMTLISGSTARKTFRALLQQFPNLRTLREIPWDEGYFDAPQKGSDGCFDTLSWYHYVLKRKDIRCDEYAIDSQWENTDINRSSVLEARTLAAKFLLRAISPSRLWAGLRTCQTLRLSIALNTWNSPDEGDIEEVEEDELRMRRRLRTRLFCSLGLSDIRYLTSLQLCVTYAVNPDTTGRFQPQVALRKLFGTATALTELSLSVRAESSDADVEEELELLEHVRGVSLPRLRKLVLSGASTNPNHLQEFLQNQAQTLGKLELHDMRLLTQEACWSTLLRQLRHIISLDDFDASCLSDTGDASNSFKHFIGPHWSKLPALQRYFCNGETWPGLDSAIEEPTRNKLGDANDLGLN